MKEAFVKFVRDLQEPVRALRQEKIRQAELAWSADQFAGFRIFVMGLHSSEMAVLCHSLADAQAAPLLEILADFAERDPNLRNTAFQSMARTSQQARIFLAGKLINSPDVQVRAKTCELLGGTAGRQAGHILEHALEDDDVTVQYAAVEAIARGDFKNLGDRILPLLHSGDKKVGFAALAAIARLGINSDDNDLLSILEDGHQEEKALRLAAAILARAANPRARAIMIAALRNPQAPFALRAAASQSLTAYDDSEAIVTVMRAVGDSNPTIAQLAHMSLNRKSSTAFADVLARIIPEEEIRIAQLAAQLLGGMDAAIVGSTLLTLLKTERRRPVVCAIALALGKSGIPGAWEALISLQKKDKIDDPEFFDALADVAREDNLAEFASFFDTAANTASKREILDRLAYFALASPVNPEMRSLALRILRDHDKSMHISAATILAHAPDLDFQEINQLLESLAKLGNNPEISGVLIALLRNKRGALAEIFSESPPETAALLAFAATEATCMGKNAVPLFRKAAAWARDGVSGAKDALRGMASLAPEALLQAMRRCPDQIFLLGAWRSLPKGERDAHWPNFRAFFSDSSARDALAAIGFLEEIKDPRSLRDVADVAFTSAYPDVRKAALALARETILAG